MNFHSAKLQEVEKWSGCHSPSLGSQDQLFSASLCLSAPWTLIVSFSKRHLASVKHTVLFPHSQGQVSVVASVFMSVTLTPTPSDPLLHFPTPSKLWNLPLFRFSEYLAQDGSLTCPMWEHLAQDWSNVHSWSNHLQFSVGAGVGSGSVIYWLPRSNR